MGTTGGRAVAVVGVAAAVLLVATVAIDVAGAGVGGFEPGWPTAVTGLVQLVPGVLLLRSMPRHAVAWVLVGSGLLWMVDGLAAAWTGHAVYVDPGLAGASAAYWFYLRFGAVLLLGLPLLLLVFPDGRLPAGRVWRPLSIASLVSTAALPAVLVVVPSAEAQRFHDAPLPPELAALALDPVSIPMPYWPAVLTVVYALAPVGLVVPFAATVARYRAAEGVRRLQLRWLVWAGLVDALAVALALSLPDPLPIVLLTVAVAVTSAAIVVAVTRYRLYEIDRLLSTTLVTAMLAVLVVVVDLGVLAVAGNLLAGRDSAFLAVAVVAVAYTPLRNRLWSAARRLVRGSRDDPYATVSTLAERLETAAGADEQLAAVARAVAEAFRLHYVRVEIATPEGGRRSVQHGTAPGRTVTLPVVYRGEPIGHVELPSAAGAELSDRDQRLFGDLVRQAAAAARASELSAALQENRQRLVTAREEERRRLRRDLHDSLGPGLGAVTLRIETARNLAAADPEAADRMLVQATADVAAALADVRRLVHDLRPPALDERGLLRAVEQQAQRLSGDDLRISVSARDDVTGLPAAVEVAAYRIASEALTNVHRHAGASRATVLLERDPSELRVEVRDDGVGIADDVAAGVGMLSLRERAAELGGDCSVGCPPGGGTVVRARLPLGGGDPT